jgi:hypothetical protein
VFSDDLQVDRAIGFIRVPDGADKIDRTLDLDTVRLDDDVSAA